MAYFNFQAGPSNWYPTNNYYNANGTAAYEWVDNGPNSQYLIPTGVHPSQQSRYDPFGTLDFSARGPDGVRGRYEPQQLSYFMDQNDTMTYDYELPEEQRRWGLIENNASYDPRHGHATFDPYADFPQQGGNLERYGYGSWVRRWGIGGMRRGVTGGWIIVIMSRRCRGTRICRMCAIGTIRTRRGGEDSHGAAASLISDSR